MKNDDTHDRLINAGADAPADALIRLAGRHNDAMKAVRRLMTTPQASLEAYRGVMKDITNRVRHPFAGLTPVVSE
jgi:hypothetical protein